MHTKRHHAEHKSLLLLLDSLANGEATFQVENERDKLYPVILNQSAGLVECERN